MSDALGVRAPSGSEQVFALDGSERLHRVRAQDRLCNASNCSSAYLRWVKSLKYAANPCGSRIGTIGLQPQSATLELKLGGSAADRDP